MPNLIIPGVAKCGTTTIYDLLVAHPRVTGGIEKEVRFLMDAHDPLCPPVNIEASGVEGWASQYADRGTGDFDVWVDASPQYQYQNIALPTLATLDPEPKVLIIVREPARRLYSLYQYARYHQRAVSDISSFAEFIDQIRPPVAPTIASKRMLANAWEDSKYDLFLERWSKVIRAENLFVTSVEELAEHRDELLTAIAHWLGIDAAGLIEAKVEKSNASVVTRNRALWKIGGRIAKKLPDNALLQSMKGAVKRFNSTPIDREEINANSELLEELKAEFAPHMARLKQLKRKLGLFQMDHEALAGTRA